MSASDLDVAHLIGVKLALYKYQNPDPEDTISVKIIEGGYKESEGDVLYSKTTSIPNPSNLPDAQSEPAYFEILFDSSITLYKGDTYYLFVDISPPQTGYDQVYWAACSDSFSDGDGVDESDVYRYLYGGSWSALDLDYLYNITLDTQIDDQESPIYSNLEAPDINLGDEQNITIEVYDNVEVESVQISIDGGNFVDMQDGNPYWYAWTPTTSGTIEYDILIKDTSDNINSASGSFEVISTDSEKPTYSNLEAPDINLGDEQNITIEVYDNVEVESVQISIDGGNFVDMQDGNPYWWAWTPLNLGEIEFTIKMEDTSQNKEFLSSSFEVLYNDIISPSFSNLTSHLVNLGDIQNITVEVEDNIQVDVVLISLHGDNKTMKWRNSFWYSWEPQSLGTIDFVIYANDTSGNWNQTSGSFDVVSPDPTLIIDNVVVEVLNNYAIINWSTNRDADSKIMYGLSSDYSSFEYNSDMTKSHSLKIEDLDYEKTYHYMILSKDVTYKSTNTSDNTFQTGSMPEGYLSDAKIIKKSDNLPKKIIVTYKDSDGNPIIGGDLYFNLSYSNGTIIISDKLKDEGNGNYSYYLNDIPEGIDLKLDISAQKEGAYITSEQFVIQTDFQDSGDSISISSDSDVFDSVESFFKSDIGGIPIVIPLSALFAVIGSTIIGRLRGGRKDLVDKYDQFEERPQKTNNISKTKPRPQINPDAFLNNSILQNKTNRSKNIRNSKMANRSRINVVRVNNIHNKGDMAIKK